jgi:hypothetical protein
VVPTLTKHPRNTNTQTHTPTEKDKRHTTCSRCDDPTPLINPVALLPCTHHRAHAQNAPPHAAATQVASQKGKKEASTHTQLLTRTLHRQ